MWELLSAEELMLLNCDVGEDSWEPLDSKEVKPINPNGDQPWIFIGRTGAETPRFWPPYVKSWLIGKDTDAGKDWRQEEKGMTKDEIVGWHHPTQWTWVWVSSGRWWRIGKPGVLQSMGLQRVRHDWATKQQILWPPDVKSWLTGRDRPWERSKAEGEGDSRGWNG